MGLDVGVIHERFAVRPQGIVYEFLWDLVEEANLEPYLWSDGNVWAEFSQRQIFRIRDQFVASHGLSHGDVDAITEWIAALEWDDDWEVA